MQPWHLHPQWRVWGSMIPCVIDPGRMEVGSGAVLLGHGGGRLENTIPRVLGQRDAVWLAAGEEGAGFLGYVPSAAVWGPSPNQQLPPRLLHLIWVLSRSTSWLPAYFSENLLPTFVFPHEGRQRRREAGLVVYLHTAQNCRALTASVYEITQWGEKKNFNTCEVNCLENPRK